MTARSSISQLLLTCADIDGRSVFRSVRISLAVGPGEGRMWVDVSANGADLVWQAALRNLAAIGRTFSTLPWDATDLQVSCHKSGVVLDGRSASLPIFVAWIALLSGRKLPEPFLATGVAEEGTGLLAPAPRKNIQGKLEFAEALIRQIHGGVRTRIWVPAGSDYDASRVPTLEIRPVSTLVEAVDDVLGTPMPGPGLEASSPRRTA